MPAACATKAKARLAGALQYFTGVPCRNGHVAPRLVSNGTCTICATNRMKKYYRADRAKFIARRVAQGRKQKGIPAPPYQAPPHCECCGRDFASTGKAPAIDHDHDTGAFRGWLCLYCNLGIGQLGDSVEGLERALRYLKGECRVRSQ